ncbi:Metallo-dependent phosphatase-like protein [Helicostylum pulchrum]|nr:Metallo-dependent phosphatase-like protein [Helicostylum pulchrum]
MKLAIFLYCVSISLIILIWQFLRKPDNLVNDCSDSRLAFQQVPSSSWFVFTSSYYPEICRTPDSTIKRKQHGYFLHITDMHVDEDYIEGATVRSACHELPSAFNAQKKHKSHPDILAGKYGTPGEKCDAPVILAQETLDWISREWKDKLDFVIWTGDNSKHDWDKKNKRKRRDIYELNQRVTDMVLDTFWPSSIPVIPSFGNNDVYPHNQIGGPDTDGDLLSFYEQMWRPWIPKDQRSTFRQGGYYIKQVAARLNVLTLNTMYFYTKNKSVKNCKHPDSPAFIQLVWFEDQLKKARSKQEKIYVIGHVPPSPRDYKGTCLSEYKRIAANYTDVVMGQFFAHLNMDHFLMFDGREDSSATCNLDESDPVHQHVLDIADYDNDQEVHVTRNIKAYLGWLREMYQDIDPLDDKRAPPNGQTPLVVVQVSPSVLPVYNPAVRIYKYEINPEDNEDDDEDDDDDDEEDDEDDDDDEDELKPHGTLLSYSQYYADLSKWNQIRDQKLEYELEYSTDEAYGMEDLTVESYFELAKAMVENTEEGQRLWSTYRHHMLVRTQNYTTDTLY